MKDYLGDGVYAEFDGFGIWLRTQAQFPVNEIYLEPLVYASLLRFVARLKEAAEPQPTSGES